MENKVTIRRQCLNVIESAVYILILEGVVVYVGESKNPYSRLGAHVKDTKKRFDTIRILPCAEHRRKYWEAVLIDRYQPLFNSKGKNKETNDRHIFELGNISRRQYIKKDECANCKRLKEHITLSTSTAPLLRSSWYPLTTSAITSAGEVFMSTVSAPDEAYAYLAHQEKEELQRERKSDAWDDTLGYSEKVRNFLDAKYKMSNPYNVSTSVTDPKSRRALGIKDIFDKA
tara:strand:- start:445 stop:1134 length:690 start_codon:yes stop_codon:yes gene_type:complete